MTYQSSEGIILHATPFRDIDTVFTVFTPQGKLDLFKKGGRNQISPLTHVEATYYIGKSTLYTCSHLSIINHHLSLRKDLPTLEAACEMLKAVRSILVAEQDYSASFENLLKCLQLLPQSPEPQCVASWFYLFLLDKEGLLSAPLPDVMENFRPTPDSQKKIKDMFYNSI